MFFSTNEWVKNIIEVKTAEDAEDTEGILWYLYFSAFSASSAVKFVISSSPVYSSLFPPPQ